MKKVFFAALGTTGLVLIAACADQTESQNVMQLEEVEAQSEKKEKDQAAVPPLQEKVTEFKHIHGISYDPLRENTLYVGTHHGLFQIDTENEWRWLATESERHDLMGFTFLNEDTMISSGHPAADSDLENPIGVITSSDRGETWEPAALHGEVDFHVLEVNAGNPEVIYGVEAEETAFYRSSDGGDTWETLGWEGLPEGEVAVYAIVSNPEEPSSLLIGLPQGIFQSDDGGESWKPKQQGITLTVGEGNAHNTDAITAYLLGEQSGLMSSSDFGETWEPLNFTLETNDAVMQIAVHPENEKFITVGTSQEHLYQTKDGGENWTKIAEAGEPL